MAPPHAELHVSDAPAPSSSTKKRAFLIAKIAVTVGALTFLLSRQPLSELYASVAELSPVAMLMALGLQILAVFTGTVRWSVLMRAYGAQNVPGLAQLMKVYLIGYFYNTYIPGAVGGDVLRGIVSRRAFGEEGTTSAMAVVIVERALGLSGVLILTTISATLFVGDRFGDYVPYAVLGLCAVFVGIIGLALGRKLARFAPGAVGRIMGSLPELVGHGGFALAAGLSVLTHVVVALIGYVLVHSIYEPSQFFDSFVAMPLAAAAGYFPATIAGAGPRDLVLVRLYEEFGVPHAAGVATAFAFLFSTLIAAGLGGILQLVAPLAPVEGERMGPPGPA